MVKKEAKWLELKKKSPELAFKLLEDFAEDLVKAMLEMVRLTDGNFADAE
jgi:hypothetical protein